MDMSKIIAAITAARTAKGWSIYRLAKESQVSCSHCYNLENHGTAVSLCTLHKILTALGLIISIAKAVNNDED